MAIMHSKLHIKLPSQIGCNVAACFDIANDNPDLGERKVTCKGGQRDLTCAPPDLHMYSTPSHRRHAQLSTMYHGFGISGRRTLRGV